MPSSSDLRLVNNRRPREPIRTNPIFERTSAAFGSQPRFLESAKLWYAGSWEILGRTDAAMTDAIVRKISTKMPVRGFLIALTIHPANKLFQPWSRSHPLLLFRKDLMGCASLHPSYGSFHGFRVSQKDVKSCYEKAAHKGLDYGSFRRLFIVEGVPAGHEML